MRVKSFNGRIIVIRERKTEEGKYIFTNLLSPQIIIILSLIFPFLKERLEEIKILSFVKNFRNH